MKITMRWLEKHSACMKSREWFESQTERDEFKLIKKVLDLGRFDWANCYVVRRLRKQESKVKYAVYAAKKALPIFEEKYPKNKAPRDAIKSAERWIKNPSEKNRMAAAQAAAEAYNATRKAAKPEAYFATCAAANCADSAAHLAVVTSAATDAANYATAATTQDVKLEIIKYGIRLMKEST